MLAGFGVLYGGFLGVDADHPAKAGFGAFGPQRARLAERTEAGDPR